MEYKFGRFLEDFAEGDVYRHSVKKTITESDNNLFSLMTMNHHPVHLDYHYAKTQLHGQVLVVGTLVFSLSVGLTVADISGSAIANLGYKSIEHVAPVFIGDTINAISKIIRVKRSSSKSDRGIVHVETTVFNHRKDIVLRFERSVLVRSGRR